MKGGELSPHIHGFSVNNRTDLPRVVAIGVATGLLYLILLITPLLLHLGPYIPQGLALIGPIRRSGEGMGGLLFLSIATIDSIMILCYRANFLAKYIISQSLSVFNQSIFYNAQKPDHLRHHNLVMYFAK